MTVTLSHVTQSETQFSYSILCLLCRTWDITCTSTLTALTQTGLIILIVMCTICLYNKDLFLHS